MTTALPIRALLSPLPFFLLQDHYFLLWVGKHLFWVKMETWDTIIVNNLPFTKSSWFSILAIQGQQSISRLPNCEKFPPHILLPFFSFTYSVCEIAEVSSLFAILGSCFEQPICGSSEKFKLLISHSNLPTHGKKAARSINIHSQVFRVWKWKCRPNSVTVQSWMIGHSCSHHFTQLFKYLFLKYSWAVLLYS